MAPAKEVTLIDDGYSKLWGRNIGPYPLHHFVIRHPAGDSARLPLRLAVTGFDEWVEGCERWRLNSSVFSLEYVKEGTFEFVQEGRKSLVGPGSVFLVRNGAANSMRTHDKHALKRTMIIEGSALDLVLSSCGLSAVDVVDGVDLTELDSLYDRAEKILRDAQPGFMREASTVVYQTLLLLGDALGHGSMPPPVRKALELFESKPGERISLDELAAYCSCSPVTLQRLFRQHLGETPLERFIGMKMELAKGMLSISSEPVKEISRRLGYSNQLYFSTEFHRRVGVSPSAWRKTRGNMLRLQHDGTAKASPSSS